jgi:hypothetical protein
MGLDNFVQLRTMLYMEQLMRKSKRLDARITEETEEQIDYLAKAWSQASPLGKSEVVEEAIRRAYAQEKSKEESKRK